MRAVSRPSRPRCRGASRRATASSPRSSTAQALRGEGDAEAALESMRLVWPAYFASPEHVMPFRDTEASVPAYAGLFDSLQQALPRLASGLPGVQVPFGFVAGERSPMPHDQAAGATARAMPGAWLEVVPGAGPFPKFQAPGRCAPPATPGRNPLKPGMVASSPCTSGNTTAAANRASGARSRPRRAATPTRCSPCSRPSAIRERPGSSRATRTRTRTDPSFEHSVKIGKLGPIEITGGNVADWAAKKDPDGLKAVSVKRQALRRVEAVGSTPRRASTPSRRRRSSARTAWSRSRSRAAG